MQRPKAARRATLPHQLPALCLKLLSQRPAPRAARLLRTRVERHRANAASRNDCVFTSRRHSSGIPQSGISVQRRRRKPMSLQISAPRDNRTFTADVGAPVRMKDTVPPADSDRALRVPGMQGELGRCPCSQRHEELAGDPNARPADVRPRGLPQVQGPSSTKSTPISSTMVIAVSWTRATPSAFSNS